eukprot:9498349-Pyramimonas_sp.AAC.1
MPPRSGAARGSSTVRPRADPNGIAPSLRCCEMPNCRHVRRLLGVPAEWGHTQTPTGPRHI